MLKSIFLGILINMSVSFAKNQNPVIQMETALGNILVEVFEKKAPISSANFLKYVDQKRFQEASFYRTVTMKNQPKNKVKIEVIQGGLGFDDHPKRLKAIKHETTKETGIKHLDGVISMARLEPGTASSEFFICIGDMPELDFGGKRNPDGQGFAAFRKVVKGMDVIKKIQRSSNSGQMIDKPIKIKSFKRL